MSELKVYTWDKAIDEDFESLSLAIKVDPRGKDPLRLVQDVLNQIEEINPKHITLRFWKEFNVGSSHALDKSDAVELLTYGGVGDEIWQYWRDFFFYLEKAGVKPEYLIHDMEEGIGWWHIKDETEREEFFTQMFELSDELRGIVPDEVLDLGSYDELASNLDGKLALGRWSMYKRAEYLNRVFREIIFYIYGEEIPHSNYMDHNTTDEVGDLFGRPYVNATMSEISSPVFYYDDRTKLGRYKYTKYSDMEKNPRWNRIIEKVNLCISCLRSGGPIVPWIAPVGYGRYGNNTWAQPDKLGDEMLVWYQVMRMMCSMGIGEYILWNPEARFNKNAVATDKMMDDLVGRLSVVEDVDPFSLEYIEYDADEIVIGNYRVNYDAIEKYLVD